MQCSSAFPFLVLSVQHTLLVLSHLSNITALHYDPAFEQEGTAQDRLDQPQASWLPIIATAGLPLLIGAPAWAAYNPADGEQLFKNAAGAVYIVLVCFFFYRLFRKRAYTGVTQVAPFRLQLKIPL